MKVLAVDLGARNVGLAACDDLEMVVTPLATLRRASNRALAVAILREAEKRGTGEIVIGHPLNMDGSAGRAAADAEKIAGLVAESGALSVRLWDERLSSWEAGRLLEESGASRRKRRRLIHSASAAVILRSYLDARRSGEVTPSQAAPAENVESRRGGATSPRNRTTAGGGEVTPSQQRNRTTAGGGEVTPSQRKYSFTAGGGEVS